MAWGACWEEAIRADERVAVELDLPRAAPPDVAHIDPVAVDLACRGERVRLTPAERAEAVRRLNAAGAGSGTIARRLRMRPRLAHAALAGLADAVPFLPSTTEAGGEHDRPGEVA